MPVPRPQAAGARSANDVAIAAVRLGIHPFYTGDRHRVLVLVLALADATVPVVAVARAVHTVGLAVLDVTRPLPARVASFGGRLGPGGGTGDRQ